MPSLKPLPFQSNSMITNNKKDNFFERQSTIFNTANQIQQIVDSDVHQLNFNNEQLKFQVNFKNNSLENSLKKQWSGEEDQLVFQLHNQYGNKWAIIAEHLKSRTDNCVKNHFYSRLRKGLRKINKIIEDQYKKTYKQFKTIDLYKIIEASDQKFKQVKSFTNQMTDLGLDIKNRLFIFAQQQQEQNQQQKVKMQQLIEDMTQFSKNYKRKSKKSRRYSPMGVDSIYRANAKKTYQTHSLQLIQAERSELQSQSKEIQNLKVETPMTAKLSDQSEKQKKIHQIKQISLNQAQKDITSLFKKQSLVELNNEIIFKSKSKSKQYRHFSDEQDQDKNEAQYIRQQRLNHFAQNLLKTFKSYYSFKSFKSHIVDDPFFE